MTEGERTWKTRRDERIYNEKRNWTQYISMSVCVYIYIVDDKDSSRHKNHGLHEEMVSPKGVCVYVVRICSVIFFCLEKKQEAAVKNNLNGTEGPANNINNKEECNYIVVVNIERNRSRTHTHTRDKHLQRKKKNQNEWTLSVYFLFTRIWLKWI